MVLNGVRRPRAIARKELINANKNILYEGPSRIQRAYEPREKN